MKNEELSMSNWPGRRGGINRSDNSAAASGSGIKPPCFLYPCRRPVATHCSLLIDNCSFLIKRSVMLSDLVFLRALEDSDLEFLYALENENSSYQ